MIAEYCHWSLTCADAGAGTSAMPTPSDSATTAKLRFMGLFPRIFVVAIPLRGKQPRKTAQASYWQVVPGAAKISRVIDFIPAVAAGIPPSCTEYANVALLPSANVNVALPTAVACIAGPAGPTAR